MFSTGSFSVHGGSESPYTGNQGAPLPLHFRWNFSQPLDFSRGFPPRWGAKIFGFSLVFHQKSMKNDKKYEKIKKKQRFPVEMRNFPRETDVFPWEMSIFPDEMGFSPLETAVFIIHLHQDLHRKHRNPMHFRWRNGFLLKNHIRTADPQKKRIGKRRYSTGNDKRTTGIREFSIRNRFFRTVFLDSCGKNEWKNVFFERKWKKIKETIGFRWKTEERIRNTWIRIKSDRISSKNLVSDLWRDDSASISGRIPWETLLFPEKDENMPWPPQEPVPKNMEKVKESMGNLHENIRRCAWKSRIRFRNRNPKTDSESRLVQRRNWFCFHHSAYIGVPIA